jgi:hypothetical protein
MCIIDFPNGLTVRELKKCIKNWPEVNMETGEDCEVWISTEENVSSPAKAIVPLNLRFDNNTSSADILLET